MSERLLIADLLTALNIDPSRVAKSGWTVTDLGDGEAVVDYNEFDVDKFGKKMFVEDEHGNVHFAKTRKTFRVTATKPRRAERDDIFTMKVDSAKIQAVVANEASRAAKSAKGARR